MNILIVGANGFLGRALAKRAALRGLRVFGLSRSDSDRLGAEFTHLCGNRNDPSQVLSLIHAQKIDVLVDVIPMTLGPSKALIERVDQHIRQYVMVSSCDVYRNYELLQRKSTGTPIHHAVDEDSELRKTRFPYRDAVPRPKDAKDRYLDDYDKIPIEHAVKGMSCDWTIVRLPMVYGPGDKQRRFRWAIKPMIRGQKILVIPSSWARWHSTYAYIDNVAEGIALTLGNPKARNRVFNIGEQQSLSQLAWAMSFADAIGWEGEVEHSDDPDHPFMQRISGLDLSVPFRVNDDRIRETLGYKGPVSRAEALSRTIASEQINDGH